MKLVLASNNAKKLAELQALFTPLGIAYVVSIFASLIVSLTLIPFVASKLLRPHAAEGNRLLRGLTGLINSFYAPLLHRALDQPRRWFWGAMALCMAAFGLIPLLGFSLFPVADVPYFLVRVETPEGSTIAATDKAVRDAVSSGATGCARSRSSRSASSSMCRPTLQTPISTSS